MNKTKLWCSINDKQIIMQLSWLKGYDNILSIVSFFDLHKQNDDMWLIGYEMKSWLNKTVTGYDYNIRTKQGNYDHFCIMQFFYKSKNSRQSNIMLVLYQL